MPKHKMTKKEKAQLALHDLLWELPYEFKFDPEDVKTREGFHVIKGKNVRKVHKALWELQQYLND